MTSAEPQRPTFQWYGSMIHWVAESGFALSRFAKPLPGGQVWQDWAYQTLISFGARETQGPGTLHLFGFPSSSGVRHEIDAAGIGDSALVIEAKDHRRGITKEHIDSFHGRTLDYFERAAQQGFPWDLYRLVWSAKPINEQLWRYAARLGIMLVERDRVPIPVLLAASDTWTATEWLNDQYLGELVLLGERACRPLSSKKAGHYLIYEHPLDLWVERDLDNLEYLHDLGSRQWLDWIDQSDPLHFEDIAERQLLLYSNGQDVRGKYTSEANSGRL